MDGTPAKMTEEEKERFTKMCSNNGEYNAVFCGLITKNLK